MGYRNFTPQQILSRAIGKEEEARMMYEIYAEKVENRLSDTIAANLGTVDDSVLDITPEKYESIKEIYDITETAIEIVGSNRNEALTSLIAEKGALLSLRR